MTAPGSEPAAIALCRVSKHFGNTRALDAVDLEVRVGEAIALVGPSGCGKTTALKLFNGLLLPDTGTVEVDGKPLNASELVNHRRTTGYVIQEVGLLPHWTVADNVATVPRLLGHSREATRQRVNELLQAVGLSPALLPKKPAQLSGGQRQRVGIARALAGRPRVLLMDEPFGAVDPLNRVRLRRLVQTLRKQAQLAVVIVTHDLDDAKAIADRVCVMRHGQLVETLAASGLAHAKDPWVREFLAPTQSQALT